MIICTTNGWKQFVAEYLYHVIILIYKKGINMQEEKKEKRKRIIVDVPPLFHKEIKTRASSRGITITDWVIMAINDRIAEERKRE